MKTLTGAGVFGWPDPARPPHDLDLSSGEVEDYLSGAEDPTAVPGLESRNLRIGYFYAGAEATIYVPVGKITGS
jgi:hypothetical protein